MEKDSAKALGYVPKTVPVTFAVRQNADAIRHVTETHMTFRGAEEDRGAEEELGRSLKGYIDANYRKPFAFTPDEEAQVSELVSLMQNSDEQAITKMRELHQSGDPRATKVRLEALARYEQNSEANSRPEGLSPTPKN
jgi:hypothetical protein